MRDRPSSLDMFETPEQILANIQSSLINAGPQNALENTLLDYEKMLEIWQAEEKSSNTVR